MIKRILLVLAMMAGALFAGAAPAQAAYGDCYNYPGTICLTTHANWGNPVWRQHHWQITNYTCRSLVPDGFNDTTTMVRNGSSAGVLTVWEHSDCTGNWFNVPSGQWTDLSGSWWNDEASAVQFTEV